MSNTLDNVAFITLTNTGYIDYTLNCLKSLELSGVSKPLHCYCIGEEGYNQLTDKGYICTSLDNKSLTGFQPFMNQNWSLITSRKFDIIYENLLKYEYVCITDGDITFHNSSIFDYLLKYITGHDMCIQLETMNNNDYRELCTGFMFIRSNDVTRAIFNPANVRHSMDTYKGYVKWNDQYYINSLIHKMKVICLPLELFPNGQYYYTHHMNINPYIIHFNWVVGHVKKEKMLEHNKWFL